MYNSGEPKTQSQTFLRNQQMSTLRHDRGENKNCSLFLLVACFVIFIHSFLKLTSQFWTAKTWSITNTTKDFKKQRSNKARWRFINDPGIFVQTEAEKNTSRSQWKPHLCIYIYMCAIYIYILIVPPTNPPFVTFIWYLQCFAPFLGPWILRPILQGTRPYIYSGWYLMYGCVVSNVARFL